MRTNWIFVCCLRMGMKMWSFTCAPNAKYGPRHRYSNGRRRGSSSRKWCICRSFRVWNPRFGFARSIRTIIRIDFRICATEMVHVNGSMERIREFHLNIPFERQSVTHHVIQNSKLFSQLQIRIFVRCCCCSHCFTAFATSCFPFLIYLPSAAGSGDDGNRLFVHTII